MENKELEKPVPVELNDEVLDDVSGGLTIYPSGYYKRGYSCRNYVCRYCGYTKTDPNESSHECLNETGGTRHDCHFCLHYAPETACHDYET